MGLTEDLQSIQTARDNLKKALENLNITNVSNNITTYAEKINTAKQNADPSSIIAGKSVLGIDGTATEVEQATKLSMARKLQVSLTETTAKEFDGSKDVTNIGISGTLPVSKGGTGQTNLDNVTVGKAKQVTSVRLTTEDLNTLWGPDYQGKQFYAHSDHTLVNAPEEAKGRHISLNIYPISSTSTSLQVMACYNQEESANRYVYMLIRVIANDGTGVGVWQQVYTSKQPQPIKLPVDPTDTSNINIWLATK